MKASEDAKFVAILGMASAKMQGLVNDIEALVEPPFPTGWNTDSARKTALEYIISQINERVLGDLKKALVLVSPPGSGGRGET